MARFDGIITAMVTPFGEDGSLDVPAARKLASHLVANGSSGVVVAGTTGESPTLTDDEKIELLEAVLAEIGNSHHVICGTGTNDTRHTVELTRRACDAGAHGVLVVTPYYSKPNEAGLRAHFAAASEGAGETPIVLYNIPGRSVINMSPEFMAELAASNPNIVAVKQANNDEIGPIEGLDILAGNDEILARCVELGGAGGITVASHLVGPAMAEVYEAGVAGDHDRARELDSPLAGIYAAMTIVPPAVAVKTALAAQGLIGATARLPMAPATEDERDRILAALEGVPVGGGS